MIKKLLRAFMDSNERAVNQVKPVIEEIHKYEPTLEKLDIKALREKVEDMQKNMSRLVDQLPEEQKISIKTIQKRSTLPESEKKIQGELMKQLPEFYAIVNEIYKRKVGIHYFDVQFIASTILAQGQKLTELKTGEGKTMVFQLPAFLYALTGRGSHVVTVNDYLAKVGGEYAGHIASELGLSVGIITSQTSYKFITNSEVKKFKGEETYKEMTQLSKEIGQIKISGMRGYNLIECDKRDAYTCNVVYGTNNEFGFDYLRDNMARRLEDIKQSELYFVIIDEADSILIDEARTPLIISAPAAISNEMYVRFASAVKRLTAVEDYTVDEKAHSAVLTEKGIEKMEKILGVKNIWEDYQMAHHLDNSLKAMTLYKKDIDYLVKDGQVLIVDQFTGRVLSGRRYSEGLHQAIEAKERVDIKQESQTLATITFQNFFRLYKIIGGGSGTILTEAEEFYKIYGLDSVSIPTNMPVIREDKTDRVYKNRAAKFKAVAEEIKRVHAIGQPILVGTTSIEDSEYLSGLVDKMGIEHEVLNAKHHEREALIVMKAGKKNAVTIATNMAGRGTDIPLEKGVTEVGGLYVLGTQRHEARRIDNQLRGRSGRQGDPGLSRFFISLDDDIMRIQGGQIVQKLMEMTNIPDEMPIEARLIGRSIESAQKKMENMHFDSRKHVVEYDDVMNQQREIFYSRRRSTLELAERAIGRVLRYPEIITKPLSDPIVVNSREELLDNLQVTLFNELGGVINKHYLNEREDKVDLEKMLDEFLDFGPDSLIAKALDNLRSGKKGTIDKDNKEEINARDVLKEELKKKETSEVREYLEGVIRQINLIKKDELKDNYFELIKTVYLENMDRLWTLHLESIQDLREGIGLRGYAQRDPLVEYKNETYKQFEQFMESVDSSVTRRIFKLDTRTTNRISTMVKPTGLRTNVEEISDILEGTREMVTSINNVLKKQQDKKDSENRKSKTFSNPQKANIGRNDPCWCGSGKKYKKCHGKNI